MNGGPGNNNSRANMKERSRLPAPRQGKEREEQVREILELRRALARTRQDLHRSRGRGHTSSSDEEPCRREELSGSLSGSLNGLSNKPCLNRELVAKLRSMTETIKMLSTENVALREENDGLVGKMEREADADNNDVTDEKLKAVIESYEKQVAEMAKKLTSLEAALAESREKHQIGERDKYKSLARRLKEERNQYKEMVEDKKAEHEELQVEIEKMTEIIGELRENCGTLQDQLLRIRQDSPRRDRVDVGVQTGGGIPPVRRASLTELSPRTRLSPKRTISNISQSSLTNTNKQQSQLQKSIELSKPKQRSLSCSSSSPSSPAKGAKIAKPVQRTSPSPNKVPASPRPSPSRSSSVHSPRGLSSPALSRIPCPTSKLASPAKSRLPMPTSSPARCAPVQDSREVLHITEDPMSQSDSSSLLAEAEAVTRIVTVQLERVLSRETSPTMEIGETGLEEEEQQVVEEQVEEPPPPPKPPQQEEDEQFPAPPSLGDLRKMSMEEDEIPATPRTLRRADSLRQKMAARRIQRTWKHFYQELEEKKAESGKVSDVLVEEEQERDEDISSLQAVILGHQGRTASLAMARARGGIFTARPWVAGGAVSEGEESEEEAVEKLQGIIRSHSFRLRTLHEEDVFSVGKVSSMRAKFSRRSPDGASDDFLADTDRNV